MAESVFGKPIDNAIQEINDKIGTVPSGQTVEGQIDALNSKIKTVTIPASRLNTRGGSGYWFYTERSNITDLIPTSATILSVFRGHWDSTTDGVPYAYGNVIGIVFTSAKSANDVNLIVTYM